MTKKSEKEVDVQGTSNIQANGAVVAIKDKVDGYTDLQQQRYYSIYATYGEAAANIVDYYTPRKLKGVWQAFQAIATEVNNSKGDTRIYNEAVTNAFTLGEGYTSYDIITKVIDVRKELGLDALVEEIPKTCLELFHNLFLSTESVQNNSEDKKYTVYTPAVAIMVITE